MGRQIFENFNAGGGGEANLPPPVFLLAIGVFRGVPAWTLAI